MSKINNISLDEVVFTDVATSDTITGMKVFEKGLKVYGDISAKFLNDFHLQTTYSNSIRKNKDYYISHVVNIKPATYQFSSSSFFLSLYKGVNFL